MEKNWHLHETRVESHSAKIKAVRAPSIDHGVLKLTFWLYQIWESREQEIFFFFFGGGDNQIKVKTEDC